MQQETIMESTLSRCVTKLRAHWECSSTCLWSFLTIFLLLNFSFFFLLSETVLAAISSWDFQIPPLSTFSTARWLLSVYRSFWKFATSITNCRVPCQRSDFQKAFRYSYEWAQARALPFAIPLTFRVSPIERMCFFRSSVCDVRIGPQSVQIVTSFHQIGSRREGKKLGINGSVFQNFHQYNRNK